MAGEHQSRHFGTSIFVVVKLLLVLQKTKRFPGPWCERAVCSRTFALMEILLWYQLRWCSGFAANLPLLLIKDQVHYACIQPLMVSICHAAPDLFWVISVVNRHVRIWFGTPVTCISVCLVVWGAYMHLCIIGHTWCVAFFITWARFILAATVRYLGLSWVSMERSPSCQGCLGFTSLLGHVWSGTVLMGGRGGEWTWKGAPQHLRNDEIQCLGQTFKNRGRTILNSHVTNSQKGRRAQMSSFLILYRFI